MSQVDDMGRPRWARPRASFGQAISWWARNLFVVNGRASRSEYWWVALGLFLAGAVLDFVDLAVRGFTADGSLRPYDELSPAAVAVSVLVSLVSLALSVSTVTLHIRRLHDINRSGWWLLLFLAAPLFTLVAIALSAATLSQQGAKASALLPAMLIGLLASAAIGIWSIVWLAQPSKPQGARFDSPSKKLPVPADANWSPANPAFVAFQEAQASAAERAQRPAE